LTVQDTVTINSHPADETVCEGEEASFSVSADGEGTLTYQWYTNASGSWETISGAENDNYQIPEVSNTDEGDYRVEVSNSCGDKMSESASLTIRDTVNIIEHPEDKHVCEGETITFGVDAEGYGSLSYTWEYNDGSGWETLTTIGDISVDEDTLTIANTDTTDEGTYRCIIENVCGTVVTDIVNLEVNWFEVSIGEPSPFTVDTNSTQIEVHVAIRDHIYLYDLTYELTSPGGNTVLLADTGNKYDAQYLKDANLTFRSDLSTVFDVNNDSPDGTYGFSDDINSIHGEDPSNGSWSLRIGDWERWSDGNPKGHIDSVYISFIDEHSGTGETTTVSYNENTNIPIEEYQSEVAYTEYIVRDELTVDCYGDSTATAIVSMFGGIPAYSIEWSESPDFSSTIPQFEDKDTVDLWAGTFYVKVTDAMGCTALDSISVTEPPEIILDSLKVTSIDEQNGCYGDSIGEVYDSAYGGTGTLYYELIRDPYDSPETIDVNTSGSFTGLPAGFYMLEVFDANGCVMDTTFEITQPDSIQIVSETHTALSDSGAADGTIEIDATGGTPPLEYMLYEFTPADTTIIETNNDGQFEGLSEGYYYVLVTDDNGCDTTKSSDIQITTLEIEFYVDSVSCFGSDDGKITAEIKGGISPYTYEWTNLAGDTLQVTDSSDYALDIIDNLPPDGYTLNVTDGNNNSELDTTYVREPDPIEIINTISDTLSAESADDGTMEITATGGNDTLFFEITNLDEESFETYTDTVEYGGTDTINHEFNNLIKGHYKITVFDENGCDSVSVTVNITHFELDMEVNPVTCNGDSNGEAIVEVKGGTPPFEYEWDIDSYVDSSRTNSISDLTEGWYYVTVTDSYGFELEDSVFVNEPEPIMTNAIVQNAICNQQPLGEPEGSIVMSPSGGNGSPYYFQWASNADYTRDSTIEGLESGRYDVAVIDTNNCQKDTTIYIDGDPDYDIEVNIEEEGDSICYGSTIELFPEDIQTNGDSLRWYPFEDEYTPKEDFDTLRQTLYENTEIYVQARNDKCYTSDKVKYDLYSYLNIQIDMSEYDEIEENKIAFLENVEEVDITATAENEDEIPSSMITYSWEPADHFVSVSDLQSTLSLNSLRNEDIAEQDVWLVAEVDHGSQTCVETDSITIKIVPNVTPTDAFSPNGDGINDTWTIKDADNYDNLEVIIYNRWGVKVFRRKQYTNEEGTAWDGKTDKGKKLPSGTYYYVIKTHEKGVDKLSGTVTIIR
ncbi:MAG: gliding motility-associated C-terminal domain-containing protein, partial [Bacteroidales bacterium]